MKRYEFSLLIFLIACAPVYGKGVIELLPERCEEALALSAMPVELRDRASVYVLKESGYEKTRSVDDAFNCLVTRNHPRSIVPLCFDEAGSKAILPSSIRRGEMSQQGFTNQQFMADREARVTSGEVGPAAPGISYMVSDFNYIYFSRNDRIGKVPPHTMYYAPYVTDEDIGGSVARGSQRKGLPFINDPGVHGMMVALVDRASDSTEVLEHCKGHIPEQPADWMQQ